MSDDTHILPSIFDVIKNDQRRSGSAIGRRTSRAENGITQYGRPLDEATRADLSLREKQRYAALTNPANKVEEPVKPFSIKSIGVPSRKSPRQP